MKLFAALLIALFAGCASISSYGEQKPYDAFVMYTGLDVVVSHREGPFDVDMLKSINPATRSLDERAVSALIAALEKSRIGKATKAQKKRLLSWVYLAIFRSDNHRKPLYVSNGCHVLNLKTGDLYRLDVDTAISIIGIPAENYESRLCKALDE